MEVPERRSDASTYTQSARARLRRFRRASALAVALTALLLFVWGAAAPEAGPSTSAVAVVSLPHPRPQTVDSASPQRAVQEATHSIRSLLANFYGLLPKLAIAAVLLLLAWLASRLVRRATHGLSQRWQRSSAIAAILGIVIWGIALIAVIAVVVGDARAVAGSIGLIGLALSWALQAPIESFTGWVLNSFRSFYRVGDRIQVGNVFGDVFRIDVLTTTVWEAGGPNKPVRAAQPTGALVTFPNSEVLRANVVNYTRDFPAVWDEISVAVANESDIPFAVEVCRDAAAGIVGEWMSSAAARYLELLRASGRTDEVSAAPEVYVEPAESWVNITIRYLVPVRERRRHATAIQLAVMRAVAQPGNRDRIIGAYPVRRVRLTEDRGTAAGGTMATPAGSLQETESKTASADAGEKAGERTLKGHK